MKSIYKVLREYKHRREIIDAVIEQLGYGDGEDNEEELLGTLSDIRNHGISGGYGGFIYYDDTVKFAKDNRKLIVAMLEEDAFQFGKEVTEMIKGFGHYRDSEMDDDDRHAMYAFLGGGRYKDEYLQFYNLMAWYAAETVARYFEE